MRLGPFSNSNLRWPLYVLCAVLIAAGAYLRNYNCLSSLRMDGDTAFMTHRAFVPLKAPGNLGTFSPVMDVLSRMMSEVKGFRNPRDPRRFILLLMTIDAILVFIISIELGLRLRWGLAASLTYLLSPIHNYNWSINPDSHYCVATFTMAGFLIHLEARRNGMTALRLLGLAATCALSFGSKESGLVFPALLWTYDFLVPTKGSGRTAAGRSLEYGILIGLTFGYLAFRWAFSGQAAFSASAAAISPGYALERLLKAVLLVRTPIIAACLALFALGASGKLSPIATRRSCFFGSWFLIGMLIYLAGPQGYMLDGQYRPLVAFSGRYLIFPFAGVAWLVGAALDECESKLGLRWAGFFLLALLFPVLMSPNPFCEGRASQLLGIERGLSLCGGSGSGKGDCLISASSLPLVRENDLHAYQVFVDGLRKALSPDDARSFLKFVEVDFWSQGDIRRGSLLLEAWIRMSDPRNPASFSAEVAQFHRAVDNPPASNPPASREHADYWLNLADAAAKGGRRQAAFEALRKGGSLNPSEDEKRRLALIYCEIGECREAVKILKALALHSPKKADRWMDLADAAAKAGDRAAALEAIGQTEKFQLNLDQRHRLALTYQTLKSFKDALRLLEPLAMERPPKAIYVSDRGLNRYFDGKVEAAIEDFRWAIKLEPGFLPPYVSLGSILVSKNRIPEAVRLYDHALANAAKNAAPSMLESIRGARNDALRGAPPSRPTRSFP